jgi:hypothetical protein
LLYCTVLYCTVQYWTVTYCIYCDGNRTPQYSHLQAVCIFGRPPELVTQRLPVLRPIPVVSVCPIVACTADII